MIILQLNYTAKVVLKDITIIITKNSKLKEVKMIKLKDYEFFVEMQRIRRLERKINDHLCLIYFLFLLVAILIFALVSFASAETCSWQRFNITAYTTGEPGVGTKTASGKKVSINYIACPKIYPFGSKFYFLGKQYFCYDRGSAINMKTKRLDIFLTSRSAVRHFGIKKNVKVKICK